MSRLDRSSEFNLTSEEKSELLKDCKKEVIDIKTNITEPQKLVDHLIGWFYQQIGRLDYKTYYNDFENESDDVKKDNLVTYLTERAHYSAMMQAFKNNVSKKGYNTEKKEFKKIDGSSGFPSKIYHGTAEEFDSKYFGEPDENGKYRVKDGITYFAHQKRAEKFAILSAENIKKQTGKDSNIRILEKTIDSDAECVELDNLETNGGTAFMYQDELIDLNEKGIKYVFSCTPQYLDIHNFKDFVDKRDEILIIS